VSAKGVADRLRTCHTQGAVKLIFNMELKWSLLIDGFRGKSSRRTAFAGLLQDSLRCDPRRTSAPGTCSSRIAAALIASAFGRVSTRSDCPLRHIDFGSVCSLIMTTPLSRQELPYRFRQPYQ